MSSGIFVLLLLREYAPLKPVGPQSCAIGTGKQPLSENDSLVITPGTFRVLENGDGLRVGEHGQRGYLAGGLWSGAPGGASPGATPG